MRLNGDRLPSTGNGDPILDDLVEELTERLQAGESIDEEAYVLRHPDCASEIRRLLPALRMMAELGRSVASDGSSGVFRARDAAGGRSTLGDFRLVREIGRGGMGVVYEAEQLSLRRRVALKVLPLASALDAQRLARFRTEAQVAAQLHHTNIVPVFAVGCEDGVHYYAMQFIAGRSLAELIAELHDEQEETSPGVATLPAPGPRHAPEPRGVAGSAGSRAHAKAVAALALQAAEALAAAHAEGVVHRDIKPANLMVDDQGHLWVTDFGLARLQADAGLTLSGDLLGTLRYMSPEQALGQRAAIDQRTDLYGLGVTFYEMLTLRPAFEAADHRALLRRILDEEPEPIRRSNPIVPHDLETVIHKAMAKEPRERYPTALALAEDLRRFLEDRPILATRPGPLDHALRWARRRWRLVGTAAIGLVVLTLMTLGGLSWSNTRLRALANRLASEKERADRHATEEARQRSLADRRLALSDRHLYAARLRLAREALDQGQMERAQDILYEIRPGPDGTDPREFSWHYLNAQARQQIVQYQRHERSVTRVIAIDGGRRIAYGTESGEVYVLDPATEEVLHRFQGHPAEVNNLAVSKDGRRLVSTSYQSSSQPSEVRIWDLATGEELGRFEMPEGFFAHVLWLSDSGQVACIWSQPIGNDAHGPLLTFDLTDPSRPIAGRTWSRFGLFGPSPSAHALTADSGGDLVELDLLTGRTIRRIPNQKVSDPVYIQISPDGRKAVRIHGGDAVVAALVDLNSGTNEGQCPLEGLPWREVLLSEDSSTIVFTGIDGTLLIWDTVKDQRYRITAEGSDRANLRLGAHLSRDGRLLAYHTSGDPGGQGPLRILDVATRKVIGVYPGRHLSVGRLAFHPDHRSIFIESGNSVKRWTFDPLPGRPANLAGHNSEAWAVGFARNGQLLVTGSDDVGESKTIKVWDLRTGALRRAWRGGPATIAALAISPDGRHLATAALERTNNLRIWHPWNRQIRFELSGHTDKVRTVAFSPDSRLLASGGSDRVIRLWDPEKGTLVGTLEGHGDNVRQVAFSPDGRTLASASVDQTVRLWDVASRRQIAMLAGHKAFSAVAYSPQGRLAVADEDGLVRFLDPVTAAELSRISREDEEVRALAFTPDGRSLATAGKSRVIRIWDVLTRQELLTLEGHTGQVNALAFGRDGRVLASVGHEGAVKLWNTKSP